GDREGLAGDAAARGRDPKAPGRDGEAPGTDRRGPRHRGDVGPRIREGPPDGGAGRGPRAGRASRGPAERPHRPDGRILQQLHPVTAADQHPAPPDGEGPRPARGQPGYGRRRQGRVRDLGPKDGPVARGEEAPRRSEEPRRRRMASTRLQVEPGSDPKRGTETKLFISRAHTILVRERNTMAEEQSPCTGPGCGAMFAFEVIGSELKLTFLQERKEPAEGRDPTRCPNCGSFALYVDPVRGERVCDNCGFVVDEGLVDQGPDWTTFEGDDRIRAGPPPSVMAPDKGLGSMV